MELSKLSEILKGQPSYRFKQINESIFKHLISDWDEVMNLPRELREELREKIALEPEAEIYAGKKSTKAVLTLADDVKIETVLISNFDGRHTVCVSSQAGCPLGCVFCATGESGFTRNLQADEIVDQVLFFARRLRKEDMKIDNVVFMGMGEPLLNLDEVHSSIKILNEKTGFNLGARSISISTCGIIEGIEKISAWPLQINLALSLHAANDKLRSRLMPINQKYPLSAVIKAIAKYQEKTNRQVMIEYSMIKGVNDSVEQAQELAEALSGLNSKLIVVNLIPLNPVGKYQGSSRPVMEAFKNSLSRNKIKTTVRESLGQEIEGACGQLAGK